jgi:hypothetical protein
MTRRFLPLTLLVVTAVLVPALAKAPTALITVSGGELTRPLQVSDPDLLRRFNPWGGGFIDSPPARASAPSGFIEPYEVILHVKFSERDVRAKYVFYYRPGRDGQRGYIYLPRAGEKGYSTNARTMVREPGWFYASQEWESQIRPLISAAGDGPNWNLYLNGQSHSPAAVSRSKPQRTRRQEA